MIRQHTNHVMLMVVPEADHGAWIDAKRTPTEWEAKPCWQQEYGDMGIPRNCYLKKGADGIFALELMQSSDKHIVSVVNSDAANAGLRIGDIVVCINMLDINLLGHKDVDTILKNSPFVALTVIDSKANKLYASHGIAITYELTEELAIYKQPAAPEEK